MSKLQYKGNKGPNVNLPDKFARRNGGLCMSSNNLGKCQRPEGSCRFQKLKKDDLTCMHK